MLVITGHLCAAVSGYRTVPASCGFALNGSDVTRPAVNGAGGRLVIPVTTSGAPCAAD